MAYHTGHRLDCDLSVDPIECFCGSDWSKPPVVDWAKIDSKPIRIEYEPPDTEQDAIFAEAALQVVQERAHARLTGLDPLIVDEMMRRVSDLEPEARPMTRLIRGTRRN